VEFFNDRIRCSRVQFKRGVIYHADRISGERENGYVYNFSWIGVEYPSCDVGC
jgi:hypothetical protein